MVMIGSDGYGIFVVTAHGYKSRNVQVDVPFYGCMFGGSHLTAVVSLLD